MGALAFFGLLLLLSVVSMISFMGVAFSGALFEEMSKLGAAWEKSLIRLLEMLMNAHVLLAPCALVLVCMFFFGNREWASSGVKYMFALPVFSIVLMVLCMQLAAKYR